MLWILFYFVLFLFSSSDEASCVVEGDAHPVNSSFITSDCSLRCYCMTGGVASCMDLCPHISSIECPSGRTLKEEEQPVVSGGVHCSCRRRFCVPEKGNVSFVVGGRLRVHACVCRFEELARMAILLPAFHDAKSPNALPTNRWIQSKLFFEGKKSTVLFVHAKVCFHLPVKHKLKCAYNSLAPT